MYFQVSCSPLVSVALEASAMTVLLFTSTATVPLKLLPPETAAPAAPTNWVSFTLAPT